MRNAGGFDEWSYRPGAMGRGGVWRQSSLPESADYTAALSLEVADFYGEVNTFCDCGNS